MRNFQERIEPPHCADTMRILPFLLCTAPLLALRPPLALWELQEPTGAPRISVGTAGPYALLDGNATFPIPTVRVENGPFGPFAAQFLPPPANNSARLFAPRDSAPAITEGIAGPNATVTLVAWVKLLPGRKAEGMVAGVWDEYGIVGGATGARQYAIFLNLGKCYGNNGTLYNGGLAGHISDVGGPTPGERFCSTAACDARTLGPDWHCLATTYDDSFIKVYVNGTFEGNANRNPYALEGGIFDPASLPGRAGAEFGVGANRVNSTPGAPFHWDNYFEGLLGGVAVWDAALGEADVVQACRLAKGFSFTTK